MLTTLVATLLVTAPTLELHVDGSGMLRFVREGRTVFAKTAMLVAKDGQLRHVDGPTLLPSIAVPAGAVALDVDLEGNVYSVKSGGATRLGRLVLAVFADERRLIGDGDFWVSPDRAPSGNPGEGTNGVICRLTIGSKQPLKAAPAQPGNQATKQPSNQASLRIESVTEIGPGRVTLGHVAMIEADPKVAAELAQIYLFEAPPVGSSRTVERMLVLGRIRIAKIDIEGFDITIPQGAKVKQRSQSVPHEKFVEMAKEEAQKQLGLAIPFRCLDALPDFVVPVGELKLDTERCAKDDTRVTVTIAVRVDGKKINSRQVTLVPDAKAEGVKVGAAVKIVFRANGAEVETTGRAKTAGWVGQSVTVVTDTGSTHTATVIGLNQVQVKL